MRTYLEVDAARIRDALPEGTTVPEKADPLFLFYAVLLRAKGTAVTAADVHDAWSAWKLTTDGEHPAIVPFEELAEHTQAEDLPYVAAIRAVATERANDDS